ncbi:MAG: hypothetical protein AB7H90_13595 [Alphaproteobacteria bacterium]
MRLLVSPGFPRSGTTYLFEQLARSRDLFNVPHGKEINYFLNHEFSEKTFLPLFPGHSDDKYYMDFSPAYLFSPNAIRRIIDAASSIEIRVVVHLRHPVDQAYAHYLHDIKAHIATREQGDNVFYPLFSAPALRKYLMCRGRLIRELAKSLGRENVFIINFHKDFSSPAALRDRLAAFLGVTGFALSNNPVDPGRWMPRYVYGGSSGFDISDDSGNIRVVPPRTLLLVNGPYSRSWPDVSPGLAFSLLQGSTSWTARLTEDFAGIMMDSIYGDDFRETLDFLGLAEADFPVQLPITAQVAVLSKTIANTIALRCGIGDRIRMFAPSKASGTGAS